MESPSTLYPKNVDLTNCDKEPIQFIGSIQDFGYLLAFHEKSYVLTFASVNSGDLIDRELKDVSHCNDFFSEEVIAQVVLMLSQKKRHVFNADFKDIHYNVVSYKMDDQLLFELEKASENTIDQLEYQSNLTHTIATLNKADTELKMCEAAAGLIKSFFGYDRVMIYKFDADWNGEIVAEEKNEDLESWLGLHYPASDIPQAARKIMLKQITRIIENVAATAVPIQKMAAAGAVTDLDLSESELRAVSPIHIEYLKNMKVGATLTAPIIFKDQLWGLVACHHYSPKYINHFERTSCKFITQIFSSQLSLRTANAMLNKVNIATGNRSRLVEQMSIHWNIHEGLTGDEYNLLTITEASGSAICVTNKVSLIGTVPSKAWIDKLRELVLKTDDNLFYTSKLAIDFPEFTEIKAVASGVLGVVISKPRKDVLFWFKPEVLQSVDWGGNPEKSVVEEDGRLTPRKSFDRWTQERGGHSAPWNDYEIAAAVALKDNIAEIIVQKYDEMAAVNTKLKKAYVDLESFSYSVSHDLRSPLRGIDGYAQIIKEDYFDELDDYGKQAIETIIKSTKKMNSLIDDILSFSGLGAKRTQVTKCNMHDLVKKVVEYHQLKYPNINSIVHVGKLPVIEADRGMIFQLMLNLMGNALKYTSKIDQPTIEISYDKGVFSVKDNGIGFDAKHESKIFGVFNRLVNDEYEGSGIGLAVAKRIVEKHRGRIWVESAPAKGATFYFELNK